MKELKLGGVGAFAADLDDFKGLCGEKWPLLLAIHKELRGKKIRFLNYVCIINCKHLHARLAVSYF